MPDVTDQELQTLRQVPLFAGLEESQLRDLRNLMNPRTFAPAHVIIREGEQGDYCYVILEGHVQFSILDAANQELILGEAGDGGFFGELSMLTGEARSARVRALSQVKALALSREVLLNFLRQHPGAAIEVLQVLAHRLHRTDTLLRQSVTPNVNKISDEKATFGQRIADQFAAVMGSWKFIIVQSVILLTWVTLNVTLPEDKRWDPYPFILLNLALSFQAAYSAPIIMMSQNRAADKDRLVADIDHQVNVKAEVKTGVILSRLDDLERSIHHTQSEMLAVLKQRGGSE